MIDINATIHVPEEDKATSIKPAEAQFIYDFLKEKEITSTLEIGFAYARSASHILAATNSPHITIDPFQANYKDIGLENIKLLGFDHLLDFKRDFSHNVLPKLVVEGKKFDFIFIDGDHKFDGIFVDFYYADMLLNNNGYVLFHDTWMRSTQLVKKFVQTNRNDYQAVPTSLRNLYMFRKVGEDNRNGMHFKEFYTPRGWLTYKLIMWMTTGSESFLKSLLFKLKEKVK